MTEDDSTFVRRIMDSPDDDAPRLAYAKHLDRLNDPRGEFIRVQCALAQLPRRGSEYWRHKVRELDLLAAHGPRWRAPIRALSIWLSSVAMVFRRGFIESLGDAFVYERVGPNLLRQLPTLRELTIRMFGPRSKAKRYFFDAIPGIPEEDDVDYAPTTLAECREFRQIDQLRIISNSLSGEPPTAKQVAAILNSANAGQLKALQLEDLKLDSRLASMLADAESTRSLQQLRLSTVAQTELSPLCKAKFLGSLQAFKSDGAELLPCGRKRSIPRIELPHLKDVTLLASPLGRDNIEIWLDSARVPALQSLGLGEFVDSTSVPYILNNASTQSLRKLWIYGDAIGDEGAIAIATCAARLTLESLTLESATIDHRGILALAHCELPQLREFRWIGMPLCSDDARALVNSTWWPQLQVIGIEDCQIDSECAAILGQNWPPHLESLKLRNCPMSNHRLARLIQKSHPPKSLFKLHLLSCEIGEQELQYLGSGPDLENLVNLDLDWNEVGTRGFCDFVEAPLAENLRYLSLSNVIGMGEEGFRALADSTKLNKLCELYVEGCDTSIEFVADRLRERFADRMTFGVSVEALNEL